MSAQHQAPSTEAATAATLGQVRRRRGTGLLAQHGQFTVRRRVQARQRDRGEPKTAGRVLRADRKGTDAAVVG